MQSEQNLEQGEFEMFTLDVPNLPQQYAPVMVAQTHQVKNKAVAPMRTMGICQPVSNYPGAEISGSNVLDSVAAAVNYFWRFEKRNMKEGEADAKVTFVQLPKHGKLVDEGNGAYTYRPESGYFGKDSATSVVEIGGYRVKLVYFLQAVNSVASGNRAEELFCGAKGYQWKISTNPDTPLDTAALQSLLSFAGLDSSIRVEISDLARTAVGETTGEGENATITLDPDVWIAKEGTEAADKMDLLSVCGG
jgi:hypothetical protein